ncbi:Rrf2 family transcriptional regulator [uncultured Azohydromonas sp.]|jgi:Rrf2 family protein|uniref:Rrf2 family transcriptional regulator n=1 Tax=uncultured Azohydromonas sp. TaxID=487342 RepID=UPI002608E70E|nr:Rrf2 family transcriptional regulator [uncultured Azohydromonas sp.]
MEANTRGRFARDRVAVAVMVDLALLSQRGPVPLERISQRQRVSSYGLELLFTQLRRHKLVRFTRGREGGYEPARRPGEITVAEVVQCVKEPPDRRSTFCAEGRVGDNAGKCLTQELWAGLDEVMHGVLSAVTIQDLIDQARRRDEAAAMAQVEALPLRAMALPRGVMPKALPVARGEAPLRLLSESLA